MPHLHARAPRPAPAAPVRAGFSTSAAIPAAASFGDPAPAGRLGKDAKECVTAPEGQAKKASRLAAFAAKRKAADLLRSVNAKAADRVRACCYVAHSPEVTLSAVRHPDGAVSGRLSGLVTCGSVWCCPVCSARKADQRKAEMNALLAWARSEGHAVVMLTQTFAHDRNTAVGDAVERLRLASAHMRRSRQWRAVAKVGNVTALEVTFGANGPHAHQHTLVVMPCSEAHALGQMEALRGQWLASLASQGLTGNGHAWDVQPASKAGAYVAKWGPAEEITVGSAKSGRPGSRTPWKLLQDARDGDGNAARLWQEYAAAFIGRRQLVWSNGLKALAGIDAALEAQAEAEAAEAEPPVTLRKWPGKSDGWRNARKRRCAILDAVETGGGNAALDAAEFGPSDAERWRDLQDAATVLDHGPEVPPPPSQAARLRAAQAYRAKLDRGAMR